MNVKIKGSVVTFYISLTINEHTVPLSTFVALADGGSKESR